MNLKHPMIVKCNKCGKVFAAGNRPDGKPNGIGFQMKDGSTYNICADCLITVGKEKGKKND